MEDGRKSQACLNSGDIVGSMFCSSKFLLTFFPTDALLKQAESEDKEKAEYGPLTQQLIAVCCVTPACVTVPQLLCHFL